jgi:hypothetical protein
MTFNLEELLTKSISTLEIQNKPLPPRPRPKRPERLTNFFLPSSPPLPSGSSSWPPPPLSPKAPPSLPGFTLSPVPPAALKKRRYLGEKAPLVSKAVEERIALLELENTNLRQQNKVLYKQNSDYRMIVQEYRACQEKTNDSIERIKSAREAIERITQAVTANVRMYETARANVRRIEKAASRDWEIC